MIASNHNISPSYPPHDNSDEKNCLEGVNNVRSSGTLVAKIGAGKQDSASYGTKELNIKKVKITVNGETQPETLVAAVGTEREFVSDRLKELQKNMFQQMESAQTGMDDAPEVLDVTGDIIRIANGFTSADLSDQQKLLVGYNQSANPPPSVYEHPEEHHDVITEYQGRINTFKNTMKSANLKTLDGRDIEEILNLWSLPYDIDPITKQIVFNLLNYETLSEHLSLNGKHAFRAYKSSGILRSSTPALICANLTLELFLQTICGDVYPYAYPKDTDPLDFVSERVHSYMMRAYVEILLRPAAEDKRIVMAIGSKSTGKTFAKHVYRGGLKQLFKVYNMDPTLWISASDDKLDFNNHPEALYNLLYCIYMLVKCQKNDEFATNERRVIDPNADACTFAMGFFEKGSAIFELVMQNFLSLCRLGGTNCAKARAIAVISYYVLLQERMTPEDALECIEQCMRPEDRSHVVAHLKFEAMAKFSVLPADMVDLEEVKSTAELLEMKVDDLVENIDACREGREKGCSNSAKNKEAAIISYYVCLAEGLTPERALARIKKEQPKYYGHLLSYLKFDAMSKFSAMPSNEVDLEEVESATELFDMKVEDFLENIDACREGRSNSRLSRNNTRDQINLRSNILTRFKNGSINIETTPINQILAHIRSVSDAMLSANNDSVRPTSVRYIKNQKYDNKDIPPDLAVITLYKKVTDKPLIGVTLELEPPESEEFARPIVGGIFDLLLESEQNRQRFDHNRITTTNSKNETVRMSCLVSIIMERVLVGEELKPFPPELKWYRCPNPDCTKQPYKLIDLGTSVYATECGDCGKKSTRRSKIESVDTWIKSDSRNV